MTEQTLPGMPPDPEPVIELTDNAKMVVKYMVEANLTGADVADIGAVCYFAMASKDPTFGTALDAMGVDLS